MQKRFITNIALLVFLNVLIKPFWIFGIDRTVQNIVGAEAYGFYFSLLNVSFLFNIFLDVGITNFNNRNIAQSNQLLNKHFSGIVVMKFLLSVIYLGITLLFATIVSYTKEQVVMLLVLCGNQFLASFILYLRSNITGLHLFKTDSLLSILDRLLMIGICSILIWGNVTQSTFKIEWFVWAQTLSYFLTFMVAAIIVIQKASFRRVRWHVPFYIMIFKKSAPFALLILLMMVYYRVDGIMLERLLTKGAYEAGVYAAAFRLLDAAVMMAYLFPVILLPTFSLMLKKKENVTGLFKLSFSIMMLFAVSCGIASYFYKYEVMDLLYINYVQYSAPVFGVLMLCFLFIAAGNIFSTLLTANGNLKYLNILALSGMLLNIILNLILIPRFKALGSAYASLVTQIIMCSLQFLVVMFVFKFKPNYRYIRALLLFIALVVGAAYGSKFLPFDWFINMGLVITVSIVLAFMVGMMSIKEVRNEMRQLN